MTLIGGQLLALWLSWFYNIPWKTLHSESGDGYSFRVRSCVSCCGVVVTSSVDETSQQETRALKEAGSLKGYGAIAVHSSWFSVLPLRAPLFLYLHHLYAEVSGKYCGNASNVASGIMTAALFVFMLIQPSLARCRIRLVAVPQCYVSVRGSHFYRSYSLSITKRFLALSAFGLVMCALLIVSFYTSISEY